jgi:hypothetical protein
LKREIMSYFIKLFFINRMKKESNK